MKQMMEHIHNSIEDVERGEKICKDCGQVLEERMINTEFDPSDIKDGMYCSLGQSTTMSKDLTNVPHSERFNILQMRKIDNHIKFDSNKKEKSRTERIDNLCQKLQLPEFFKTDFLQLAFKAKQDRLTSGRTINEIDAGIIMYLCKRHSIPKSMKTIADAVGIKSRQIWKPLKLVTEKYGEQNIVMDIESYVPQITSRVTVTPVNQKEILRILKALKTDGKCEGNSPLVLIAAILLTVLRKSGDIYTTQKHVANVAGVSEVAIRLLTNRLKIDTI